MKLKKWLFLIFAVVLFVAIKPLEAYAYFGDYQSIQTNVESGVALKLVGTEGVSGTSQSGYVVKKDDSGWYKKAAQATVVAELENGYSFEGWYNGDALVSEAQSFEYTVNEFSVLTAVARLALKFTVTYDANGGSFASGTTNSVGYGIDQRVVLGIYAEPSHETATTVFKGWYTDAACADGAEFDLSLVTTDVTVYAKWQENVPMLAAGHTWFTQDGAAITRSSVTEIEFVDSIQDSVNYSSIESAVDTWDASEGKVGTVTAYAFETAPDAGTYTLTVAGNDYGCIYMNPDSSRAFADVSATKDYFSNLKAIQGGETLNSSKVDTMYCLFNRCASLTEDPKIQIQGSDLRAIFQYCTSLKSIDASNWDLSDTTLLKSAFFGCTSLEAVYGTLSWDVSNVTTMANMFALCTNLLSLDLSNWDVSKVTTMSGMFTANSAQESMKLTSIGDTSKWNTISLQNTSLMFQHCSALKELNVSNWDVSDVTTMQNMFGGCSSLVELDVSNWVVSNVTNMAAMFADCTSLEVLDVSNWKTGNVTTFKSMFCGNYGMYDMKVKPDVTNWDTSSATDMSYMFYSCAQITNLDLSNWDVSKVTTMNHMFTHCPKIESIDFTGWNTEKLTNIAALLNGCKALTSVDVSDFDTANIVQFSQAFEGCSSLTEIIGLDKWDTSKATMFYQLFKGCINLQSIDLSSFTTNSLTDARYMFESCSNLTSLDLSTFKTDNLQKTMNMFKGCDNLHTVYVSDGWTTQSVDPSVSENTGNEFLGCTNLVGGSGTAYSADHVDYTYAKVDGGPDDPGYFTHISAKDSVQEVPSTDPIVTENAETTESTEPSETAAATEETVAASTEASEPEATEITETAESSEVSEAADPSVETEASEPEATESTEATHGEETEGAGG